MSEHAEIALPDACGWFFMYDEGQLVAIIEAHVCDEKRPTWKFGAMTLPCQQSPTITYRRVVDPQSKEPESIGEVEAKLLAIASRVASQSADAVLRRLAAPRHCIVFSWWKCVDDEVQGLWHELPLAARLGIFIPAWREADGLSM